MSNKEKILDMRYTRHMRPTDIAKKLKVSKPYITKVIKGDKRYFRARENQKMTNKQKNKDETKEIIYAKREHHRSEYEAMKLQHIKDVRGLSERPKYISKLNIAKWNRSAYGYATSASHLILRDNVTASYAMPKKVSHVISPHSIK